jgi:phytoene dehydrogenase-like protein
VLVREARDTPGGGASTEPLTLPGFAHDVCSAVHPLAIGSPFFRRLPLAAHGLEWIQPPVPLAHPFDDGSAALLERSTAAMERQLGPDAPAWQALMNPFVRRWEHLFADAVGPLKVPRHPLLLARFGLAALPPATLLAHRLFRHHRAPALFGGIAAHATLPLNRSVGLSRVADRPASPVRWCRISDRSVAICKPERLLRPWTSFLPRGRSSST